MTPNVPAWGESNFDPLLVKYRTTALRDFGGAIARLAAAIDSAEGNGNALAFVSDQQESAGRGRPSNWAKRFGIPPDAAQANDALPSAIEPTSYADPQAATQQFLKEGRPRAARNAFVRAYLAAKTDDKRIAACVEGVARTLRAKYFSCGPANAFVVKMARGEPPAEMSGIPADQWDAVRLQIAGQRVMLDQLQDPRAKKDTKEQKPTEQKPTPAPAVVSVRGLTLGDPRVVAATTLGDDAPLAKWFRGRPVTASAADAAALDVNGLNAFVRLLDGSGLDAMMLFQLAHAYQFSSGESDTDAVNKCYVAACKRAVAELNAGQDPVKISAILRTLKDHMGGYKAS